MKKMIFSAILLSGFAASAAQVPMFKCTVPGKSATVTVNVAVSDNEPMDYITIDINDKGTTSLFMQMEKDSFRKAADMGSVTTLVLGDQFAQGDDGVIRDGGILGLGLENGKWGGLLSAKGNVYPLECNKL